MRGTAPELDQAFGQFDFFLQRRAHLFLLLPLGAQLSQGGAFLRQLVAQHRQLVVKLFEPRGEHVHFGKDRLRRAALQGLRKLRRPVQRDLRLQPQFLR